MPQDVGLFVRRPLTQTMRRSFCYYSLHFVLGCWKVSGIRRRVFTAGKLRLAMTVQGHSATMYFLPSSAVIY